MRKSKSNVVNNIMLHSKKLTTHETLHFRDAPNLLSYLAERVISRAIGWGVESPTTKTLGCGHTLVITVL